MLVRLCGVRGSTPAPGEEFVRYGGHTTCVALSQDGEAPSLILDAGTGIREVTSLLGGSAFSGTILLTHLHWDHTQGLPFFHAADNEDSRVHVVLPEQDCDPASLLAREMSPPFYPVAPTQLRGAWSFASLEAGMHELAGFQILAREIPHKGGRTFGYRITDGRATITFMPDHCPTAMGPGEDGLGAYHDAALELARDTDLLIHDAQLLPEELEAQGCFGHAAADYAVALARRAGARAVVLFHHAPGRTDAELDELGERIASPPEVTLAREGTALSL